MCSRWAKHATSNFEKQLGKLLPLAPEFQVGPAQRAPKLPDDKLQKVFRELQPRKGMQEMILEYKEVWGYKYTNRIVA